jgi:hypothetical protein
MVKSHVVLASVATAGLLFANPAFATTTRSGMSLPRTSTALSPAAEFRTSAPLGEANEAGHRRSAILLIFLALVAAGILIVASTGGHDSPG